MTAYPVGIGSAATHPNFAAEVFAMTRNEFLRVIEAEAIRPSAFDLEGQGDECYVLTGNTNYWTVHYSERGLETEARHFASESQALVYLLDLLQSDPSTRL